MDARKGVGIGSIAPRGPGARPATRAGALNPESIDEQPELTQEQREELRTLLETRRAEILASIETRQEQERDTGREVGDEMDEANIEGATAMASRLLERDVQLLSEIDRALAKFSDGTYGLCEGTGEPIGFPRLRSRPWARFSVEYQEQLEREARTRGGI
ncbi:TraR/DksA family transcriptional regulator [Polyangium sp. y55x31]|uniref:TraR/DksA family transcriptional regulator n=1 Tax=Polyangium sp. y55x31 TaxID=3042688 RepID=UPI0024827ADA|nr:TraR/DksA family transcriptional regulator [Polyangium sp. y55x31]MDI1482234.1 TraR/DksA family transcriptional regulator [Polyangium sp. y55x31]